LLLLILCLKSQYLNQLLNLDVHVHNHLCSFTQTLGIGIHSAVYKLISFIHPLAFECCRKCISKNVESFQSEEISVWNNVLWLNPLSYSTNWTEIKGYISCTIQRSKWKNCLSYCTSAMGILIKIIQLKNLQRPFQNSPDPVKILHIKVNCLF
jgi:hypothetical protein